MPPRTTTVPPAPALSAACWRLAQGEAAEPQEAPSLPVGATYTESAGGGDGGGGGVGGVGVLAAAAPPPESVPLQSSLRPSA